MFTQTSGSCAMQGSQLKVPMYIMESGAPFDDNESGRAEFINSALEQVRHCCGNTDLVT